MERAKNEILEAWKRYDNATGDEKIKLFFKVTDLVISYQKKDVIDIAFAAYCICHCSLGPKWQLPKEFEPITDEACDLEVGEDFIDPRELKRRWDVLVAEIEKLKAGFL
jgi:hypothetical protein